MIAMLARAIGSESTWYSPVLILTNVMSLAILPLSDSYIDAFPTIKVLGPRADLLDEMTLDC
jgi:hypothetical protein